MSIRHNQETIMETN